MEGEGKESIKWKENRGKIRRVEKRWKGKWNGKVRREEKRWKGKWNGKVRRVEKIRIGK